MIQDWLSGGNSSQGYGPDNNPVKDMMSKMVKTPLYDEEEVGLFHPKSSSIVKIRENGCIDIFTATNQGFRIDPNTQTINIVTENELHHSTRHHEWIDGSATFETHEEFNVISDSDINFTTKKSWNVFVDGDVRISSKGDINLTADGRMNFKAKGAIRFDAPDYDFD